MRYIKVDVTEAGLFGILGWPEGYSLDSVREGATGRWEFILLETEKPMEDPGHPSNAKLHRATYTGDLASATFIGFEPVGERKDG